AFAAALAEAATDTVSSECGQALSDRARLITTGELVAAGTDGGLTATGTIGGIFAATLIALACTIVGLLPPQLIWIPILAGTFGMLTDSLLGAILERRNFLNNDTVNFLGTLTASSLSLIFHALTA